MNSSFITLQELHQFDNLEFLARQVVEGFIIGLHKSPFHGFSVEFAEHRLYNPGESVKDIDWKVYARTDRMFVKKFEEETNLRCQIVLDTSSSMYFPFDRPSAKKKIHFAALSAASIMYLMKKQRDAVGLTIFSDEVNIHTRARSNTVHHRLLTSYMQDVISRESKNHRTAAAKCLHQIADSIHRRSLVIIFSDMFENIAPDHTGQEDLEDLFAALQHLKHNKHEVVLFHVVDKKQEMEFEFENRPYIFVDAETGEKVKVRANQVKEHYVEQMHKFKKELELRCGQYHIDFVEADINKDFRQVLIPYLVKRTRMGV